MGKKTKKAKRLIGKLMGYFGAGATQAAFIIPRNPAFNRGMSSAALAHVAINEGGRVLEVPPAGQFFVPPEAYIAMRVIREVDDLYQLTDQERFNTLDHVATLKRGDIFIEKHWISESMAQMLKLDFSWFSERNFQRVFVHSKRSSMNNTHAGIILNGRGKIAHSVGGGPEYSSVDRDPKMILRCRNRALRNRAADWAEKIVGCGRFDYPKKLNMAKVVFRPRGGLQLDNLVDLRDFIEDGIRDRKRRQSSSSGASSVSGSESGGEAPSGTASESSEEAAAYVPVRRSEPRDVLFCSEMVVLCYCLAAQDLELYDSEIEDAYDGILESRAEAVSPKSLEGLLRCDARFKLIGRYGHRASERGGWLLKKGFSKFVAHVKPMTAGSESSASSSYAFSSSASASSSGSLSASSSSS